MAGFVAAGFAASWVGGSPSLVLGADYVGKSRSLVAPAPEDLGLLRAGNYSPAHVRPWDRLRDLQNQEMRASLEAYRGPVPAWEVQVGNSSLEVVADLNEACHRQDHHQTP